ncbi:hypothetical protein [Halobaculum gomorrense]|uniref:Uncharacterized protein n=1 Tax=Halobaculum gomorrense TaxID=43928 RepID=A0A1M5MMC1_9EURY|nr:hypothetical protein [Halobaculum gomorrense]SHG78347.1 hypothetical protein SAMN05443636_1062 [Halobaculum gomorrense]
MSDEISLRVEQSRSKLPAAVTIPTLGGIALVSFAVSLHELAYSAPVYTPLEGAAVVTSLFGALAAGVLAYAEAWHADVGRR